MARSTDTKDRRRAPPNVAETHIPLNPVTHSLLSALLSAIDRRVSVINALGGSKTKDDYEPETCDACGGTGLILVASTIVVDDDDDSDDDKDAVDADDDSIVVVGGGPVLADTSRADEGERLACTAEMRAYMDISAAFAAARDAAYASVAGSSVPLTALSGPGVPPVLSAAGATPDPASNPAPVTSATTAPVAAPSPAMSASSATNTPAGTPAPPPMSSNGPVPAASQVLVGFNRLGPAYPVPAPANAVFCVPGGERYYAVTKGIRVGVFGGWLNTTPYVTGVPSSASSRHSTIEAAYDVYCDAYHNGLVSYI